MLQLISTSTLWQSICFTHLYFVCESVVHGAFCLQHALMVSQHTNIFTKSYLVRVPHVSNCSFVNSHYNCLVVLNGIYDSNPILIHCILFFLILSIINYNLFIYSIFIRLGLYCILYNFSLDFNNIKFHLQFFILKLPRRVKSVRFVKGFLVNLTNGRGWEQERERCGWIWFANKIRCCCLWQYKHN